MRAARSALWAAALALVAPSTLAAQANCADSAGVTYQQCALRWDRGRLYQGLTEKHVTRQGFFGAARLTRFVQGDSAMRFARLYERNSKRSNAFLFLGTALYVAGFIAYENRDCTDGLFPTCSGESLPIVLSFAGLSATLVGATYVNSAVRAASKSIWWHNAKFAAPR